MLSSQIKKNKKSKAVSKTEMYMSGFMSALLLIFILINVYFFIDGAYLSNTYRLIEYCGTEPRNIKIFNDPDTYTPDPVNINLDNLSLFEKRLIMHENKNPEKVANEIKRINQLTEKYSDNEKVVGVERT